MNIKKLMIAALLALSVLAAGPVLAENNFIELGADVMFYDNFSAATDLNTNVALNARWGTFGSTGLYAWGSYEQPNVKFTGINVSKVRTWGVGGGLRVPFDNGFYAFTELGYYFPSSNSAGIDVDYDGNLGGSLGLGYDITDHWAVSTKYRFLKIDADVAGIERSQMADMAAISLGVSYRF